MGDMTTARNSKCPLNKYSLGTYYQPETVPASSDAYINNSVSSKTNCLGRQPVNYSVKQNMALKGMYKLKGSTENILPGARRPG